MPSAIDPSKIPGALLDPDTIETQAATITTLAGSVRDNGSGVHLKWQGMAGVYSAPESGTLLGLMRPVSTQATQAGDNLDAVADALTAFAADVRPIKAALDSLRIQAQAFVDTTVANGVQVRELNPAWVSTHGYYGGYAAAGSGYGGYGSGSGYGAASQTASVPQYRYVHREWHEDQEAVDRNNELIRQVNEQQVLLWEAERACANRIRALYGAAPLHSARSEDDPLAYGLDEIPDGTEMPWGAEVERSEGCGEKAFDFVVKDFLWEGICVGGVWGTIQGLGTLVLGYNPATGDWFSGDAYGAAWSNLGLLAAGLAINATPPLNVMFAADDVAQQFGGGFLPDEIRDFKDKTDEAALNTGKALIAWDKWQDDPGTALGESVFNVGTALIPVGGAAVAGVKTAGTAASVIGKMARVADLVDPGAWAVNGAVKVGGLTFKGIDGLLGKLDFAGKYGDGFALGDEALPVYTATDPASALDALQQAGVPLDDITASTRGGVDVFDYPGGTIELPAGSFDAVHGADAVDAAMPAREPELVLAGSVRGEGGSTAVDSIVHDAPVRTGTGGTDAVAAGGRPDGVGAHGGGNGGSGDGPRGGAGDAGDAPRGDGADGGAGDGGAGGDTGAAGHGDGDPGHADDGHGGDAGSAAEGTGAQDAGAQGADVPPAHPQGDAGDVAWRSSEHPDLVLTHAEKTAVDDYLSASRAAEPRLTADLVQVVDAQPGARLEGLEHRLKSDESMYRKVSDALGDALPGSGATVESVLSQMKDSVRYTVILPADEYSAGVSSAIRDLVDDGYQPYGALKNSWGGEGYQGINSNWVDPASGRIIEVQFHTDESFAAKMDTHPLYELERLPGQAPDVVADLQHRQQEIFDQVQPPAGAADVDWPADAGVVHRMPGASTAVVDAADVGTALSPEQVTALRSEGWMVAFFDDSAASSYYSGPADTLGVPGRPFFVMPVEDAGVIRNAHDAARYTGMSPATLHAHMTGGDVHGLAFPVDGVPYRVPTTPDAQEWPHYLPGGHTAVLMEPPNSGYLVNPTHEYVIPGGTPVMPTAFRFVLDDGRWIVERVW